MLFCSASLLALLDWIAADSASQDERAEAPAHFSPEKKHHSETSSASSDHRSPCSCCMKDAKCKDRPCQGKCKRMGCVCSSCPCKQESSSLPLSPQVESLRNLVEFIHALGDEELLTQEQEHYLKELAIYGDDSLLAAWDRFEERCKGAALAYTPAEAASAAAGESSPPFRVAEDLWEDIAHILEAAQLKEDQGAP